MSLPGAWPRFACKFQIWETSRSVVLVQPVGSRKPVQQRAKSAGVRGQLPLGRAAERTGATAGGLQAQHHWLRAILPVVRDVLIVARHPSPVSFQSQTALTSSVSLCSYGPQVSGAWHGSVDCLGPCLWLEGLSSALSCLSHSCKHACAHRRTVNCRFSGLRIYPGRGIQFIRSDGSVRGAEMLAAENAGLTQRAAYSSRALACCRPCRRTSS